MAEQAPQGNPPGGIGQAATDFQNPGVLPGSTSIYPDALVRYIAPAAAREARNASAALLNQLAANILAAPANFTRVSAYTAASPPTAPAAAPLNIQQLFQEMTFGQQDRIIRCKIGYGMYYTRTNVSPLVVRTIPPAAGVGSFVPQLNPQVGEARVPFATNTALIVPGQGPIRVRAYNFSFTTVGAIVDYRIQKRGDAAPSSRWRLGKVTSGRVTSKIYAITDDWLETNGVQADMGAFAIRIEQEYILNASNGIRCDFRCDISNNPAYTNAVAGLKTQRKILRQAFRDAIPAAAAP